MRYAYLLPYAGEMVLIGGAVAVFPPVDVYLGLAASMTGDTAAATHHFTDAVAIADCMGARAYAARAQVELATLKLGSAYGDAAQMRAARRIAGEAAENADELGYDIVRVRAVAALSWTPVVARVGLS